MYTFRVDDLPVESDLERIGPYRLEARLGAGGMGEVWRAWDERLKRRVALKRIRPQQDPSLRARFRREAEAGTRLKHPSIVQVYDILEEPGGDWLVMELVEGGSLREKIDPPTPAEVLRWARQIAEGLQEAHRHGIVHRDLKAGNVMLTESGQAKIADFGLAKKFGTENSELSLSASGALVGTVASMSPEQALGLQLDGRSDLFSLGILLFELVAGENPFAGRTTFETLRNICHEAPAVPLPAKGWPPALLELIRHLLQKDPADRPQSATEVAAELAEIAADSTGPTAKLARAEERETESYGVFEALAAPRAPGGAAGPVAVGSPEAAQSGRSVRSVRFPGGASGAVVALLLLAVAAGLAWWGWPRPASPSLPATPSAAVLSFINASGDPELDWLETAFPEALGAKLALGGSIRVADRRQVVDAELDLGTISKQALTPADMARLRRLLGADYAVGGHFTATGGTQLALYLTLWDLRRGREEMVKLAAGELRAWLAVIDRASGSGYGMDQGIRELLGAPPLDAKDGQMLGLDFPRAIAAVRLWAEGLARLGRFDPLEADELFQAALAVEPHYRIHEAKAAALAELDLPAEALASIEAARAMAGDLAPARALELSLAAARLRGDEAQVLGDSERLHRDHFAGDLLYTLRRAKLMQELGKSYEVMMLVDELGRLPLGFEHPELSLRVAVELYRGGTFVQAASAARQSLTFAEELGAPRRQALARLALAHIATARGDPSKAAVLAREAKEIFARVGDRKNEAACLELAAGEGVPAASAIH